MKWNSRLCPNLYHILSSEISHLTTKSNAFKSDLLLDKKFQISHVFLLLIFLVLVKSENSLFVYLKIKNSFSDCKDDVVQHLPNSTFSHRIYPRNEDIEESICNIQPSQCILFLFFFNLRFQAIFQDFMLFRRQTVIE